MKKITFSAVLCILVFTCVTAQQEKGIIGFDNWLNPWAEFKPNKTNYGEPTQILTGDITSDITLKKRDIYLLLGDVFVTDSTTLTIEPGTVILGDYKTRGSLTISSGSKIIAEGEQTDPIVFTSNRPMKKPGDWGGLFILSDAPTNKFGNESSLNFGLKPSNFNNITFGGENEVSNSGILSHVRIEYAGRRTKDFGYFNGLTLAGVGNETMIENVMVSYCSGDAFSIIGGNVTLNKLVSYKSNRNDYKFNHGAQVIIENSIAVRSPYVSSPDGYRCMYVSSYNNIEDIDPTKPNTLVLASNLTMINVSDDLKYDISIGLVKEAIYIEKDATFSLKRSVISGFNPAVFFDEDIQINNENLQKINFERTYFNNCKGNIFTKYNSNNEDLESWYGSRAFDNVYSKGPDSETFIDLRHPKTPDFRLRINKIVATTDSDEIDDLDDN
ncbi:hypothetical protein [Winogradskyella haliclonae]|uniref:T9SS C-terminal target domain-containing protein n=1 Tax=Winogradskyella haliclonae TaxID=2048558 RepID=A0ABQ2BZE0_9FLAO|nr:hypothetical protein [Winogradskyella haliclonae]GGI57474.1 hypothetical protein GCM10011444_17830 [Winogradskyella haliclonae]